MSEVALNSNAILPRAPSAGVSLNTNLFRNALRRTKYLPGSNGNINAQRQ